MADLNLKEIQRQIDEIKKSLGQLGDNDFANKLMAQLSNLGKSFVAAGSKARIAKDHLAKLADIKISPELSNSLKNLGKKVGEVMAAQRLGLLGVGKELKNLGGGWSSVGNEFASAETSFKQFDKALKLLPESLRKTFDGKILEGIKKLGEDTAKAADQFNNLEASFMKRAAAAGQFSMMLEGMGSSIDNLGNTTLGYIGNLKALANESGLTIGQVAKFEDSLKELPDRLDTFSTKVAGPGGVGAKMSMFAARVRLAAGTGQSLSKVIQLQTQAFDNLGIKGEGALKFISNMSVAADKLGLPLRTVQEYTNSAADSFKFFGDNTKGVLEILGRFSDALKGSNIGPRAISQLVQGVTRNISQMTIAQRAFTSGMAGGVGGLRGAFKMSLALEKGDLGAVFQDVEKSLRRQFGRRIVGLEEAAATEGGARQYTKQLQLLTQGPNAIAQNERQAQLIIRALKQQDPGEFAKILKQEDKNLADKVDLGTKIQERHSSQFNSMINELELIKVSTSKTAAELAREVLPGRAERMKETREDAFPQAKGTSPRRSALQVFRSYSVATVSSTKKLKEFAKSLGTAIMALKKKIEPADEKQEPAKEGRGKEVPAATGRPKLGAVVPQAASITPGRRTTTEPQAPPAARQDTRELRLNITCETCGDAIAQKAIKNYADRRRKIDSGLL